MTHTVVFSAREHIQRLLRLRRRKLLRLGFAVYYLRDPQGAVRYVGCTSDPTGRLEQHLGVGKDQPLVKQWIRDLEPARPELLVQCAVETQEEGERIEQALVALQRRRGAQLLNDGVYRGGDSPEPFIEPQRVLSDALLKAETKEELRARMLATRQMLKDTQRAAQLFDK